MGRGITEDDVWKACDALLLEGARPTIERVRQRLGRGSPNTVSPMLETWFKHLGGRIADPGAFATPAEVPETILQAAKHFWEAALSFTRADFDTRLQDGLAAAVANVEAEKERASQAGAAAFEASARASKLQVDLTEQGQLLEQARQELAAERARLEEVRSAVDVANDRLRAQEQRSTTELNDLRQQLAGAIERADAADRRVALELERERTGRDKAERQAEALQKALDLAQKASTAATAQAQRSGEAARDRESALRAQLTALAADLALKQQRLEDLRSRSDASAADAAIARAQAVSLQNALERVSSLIKSQLPGPVKGVRRSGKSTASDRT